MSLTEKKMTEGGTPSLNGSYQSEHTFHIPVMGTAFTIDTAFYVARYGISSVLSLVDDVLVEQMRKFHCEREDLPYEPIDESEEDYRARRITAYLNVLGQLVERQVKELQAAPFEPGSEITRYYEMLPETHLKGIYRRMLTLPEGREKTDLQVELRRRAVPGTIDVNIMTKVDREVYRNGEKLPTAFREGTAALRGYAKSNLASSIIFSSGMNPHLYGSLALYDDFFPAADGTLKKKVIMKVSDYRSALVQGKFLAKKGIWVSEYRVESGLNCGGHAFASKGHLLGPILEEFKQKKQELAEELHGLFNEALAGMGRDPFEDPLPVKITAQGGIATAQENNFLMKYYNLDGTGWGTPFLLVPEVCNVDEEHIAKLIKAKRNDVWLSESSPFGVPFWNLRNSASEEARRQRIAEGHPGAPCVKGYVRLNTEFTEIPICTAARSYQKLKLKSLTEEKDEKKITLEQHAELEKRVLGKSCICHDLAGGATLRHGIDPKAHPAICTGPNIAYFSRIASLQEMVDHIYGRISLMTDPARPHMFIEELRISVGYLREELHKYSLELSPHPMKHFREFRENLLNGIEYYRLLARHLLDEQRDRFHADLEALREELESIRSMMNESPSGA